MSIARRVQDPLAELVKIDPKHIGIGTYQVSVSCFLCQDAPCAYETLVPGQRNICFEFD